MKKKIVSLLLVVAIMITLLPTSIFAVTDNNSGILSVDDTTYNVTFNAKNGDQRLRYVEIMIVDSNETTVGYVTTNSRGTATYDLPAGTFTAIISYTSGNRIYYAENTFTVSDNNSVVDLAVTSRYSEDAAQNTYNKTTYFDHVDIRVKGTYTTGTSIDLTTYNIRLANVSIAVDNPGTYTDYNQSFTNNSETYEWRKTGIRIYKGASVTLNCDIYNSETGDVLKSGFTHVFYDGTHNGVDYGSTDFVKAIQQCDANQGLDFIIDPTEIIEAIYHDVSYQWTVAGDNDTLAAELLNKLNEIAAPPVSEADEYAPGTAHNIDKSWTEGSHFIIQADNGKYYRLHFEGWLDWSNETTSKTPIGDQTSLNVSSDTVIYGEWIIEEMSSSTAYLKLTKTFAGDLMLSDLSDEELKSNWFTVTTPEIGNQGIAITYDVEFAQMTAENNLLVYYLPISVDGEYIITEYKANIPGYVCTASVNTTPIYINDDSIVDGKVTDGGDGLIGGSFVTSTTSIANSAAVEVEIPTSVTRNNVTMGSINFINTYTKQAGNNIYNYPNLAVNKLDADNRTILPGAMFELQGQDGSIVTNEQGVAQIGTSDESGYLYFRNLLPGTYYLVETAAPEGYLAGFARYRVSVTLKEGYPKEILSGDAWCQYFEYDMNVDYSLDNGGTWNPSQHFSLGTTSNRYRLAAFNEKISGQLTVSKEFTGVDNSHYPDSITVCITSPSGTSQNVILNTDNNWQVTLTGLELGTYYLSEDVVQIPGYDFKGTTYNGQTSSAVTISESDLLSNYDINNPVAAESMVLNNTYEKISNTQHVYPSLKILKQRNVGGELLSGASFQLYKSYANGSLSNLVAEGTTNTVGSLVFQNLSEGTYYLQEAVAPKGYAENNTIYEVIVAETERSNSVYVESTNSYVTVIYYDVSVNALREGDNYNPQTNQLVVKNTKAVGSLTIRKTFGVNNAYLPNEIKATVIGPNNYSNVVTLNATNNWTVTLTELPFGSYTVTEPLSVIDVEGHPLYSLDSITEATVTLSSGIENGIDLSNGNALLKNTYTKEVVNPASFQVCKIDSESGDAIATGAEFTLYSDINCSQVIQVQTSNIHGFAYFHGFTEEATYYLKETIAPDGYELDTTIWKVEVSLKNGAPSIKVNSVTNILETIYDWIIGNIHPDSSWVEDVLYVKNAKKTGKLTVKKVVDDPKNHYSDAEYSFTLDTSDDRFDQTFTLKAGDSKVISGIPWGTTYSLTEDTTDAAYTNVIADSGNGIIWATENSIVVTNTYSYTTHNMPLTLNKVDSDNTTQLLAGAGFTLYSTKECKNAVNEEVYSDKDGRIELPIDKAGTYYLKETTAPDGYHINTTVYTVTAEEKYIVKNAGTVDAMTEIQMHIRIPELVGTTTNQIDYIYNINNTAIKKEVVTVTKSWEDAGYYKRPDSVEVTLFKDNIAYQKAVLNAENNWTKTWDNLTDAYTWSVDEVNVPAEYTKSVTNNNGIWTITNTRTPKPVEITVTKNWQNNNGNTQPTFVNVTLFKNGNAYETVSLSEKNNWTHTWNTLTDEFIWSVDETTVPVGYEKTITVDGFKFVIENKRIITPVDISVKKEWIASDGVVNPASIDAVLYRDGKEYKTVTLSKKNDWSYVWSGLTDEHVWTVDEKDAPNGYSKTITKDGNAFTITNTKDFKYIDVSVKKIWCGSETNHPNSTDVVLYRNGKAYDNVTLNESNNWSYVWADLTDEFEWTVDEPSVPKGYTKTVAAEGLYNYCITNTHENIPQTGDSNNILGLGATALISLVGFGFAVYWLIVTRKKGKYER